MTGEDQEAQASFLLLEPVFGKVLIEWDIIVMDESGDDEGWSFSVFATGGKLGGEVSWDITLIKGIYKDSGGDETGVRPEITL